MEERKRDVPNPIEEEQLPETKSRLLLNNHMKIIIPVGFFRGYTHAVRSFFVLPQSQTTL